MAANTLIILSILIWTLLGTLTFRRVGGMAIETPRHKPRCRTRSRHEIEFATCVECSQYMSVATTHDHRKYCSSRNAVVNGIPNPNRTTPKWSHEVCNCNPGLRRNQTLAKAAALSYTLWPVGVFAYAFVNTGRAYANYKGEDWNFFSAPKMVDNKEARALKYSKAMKRVEELELEVGIK